MRSDAGLRDLLDVVPVVVMLRLARQRPGVSPVDQNCDLVYAVLVPENDIGL